MPRRLPPLNALRAFEAAGRHLSFTKAADELNVTQAAVSHQVKALEDYLQTPLFRRGNRAILLTDAGQAYLRPVRDALDAIAEATHSVTAWRAGGPLRVTTLASFAAKWLMPRLGRFHQAHPEIDVLVSCSQEVVDLHRDDLDAAIRFGSGAYPGLEAVHLMDEEVFPVCSPALAAGNPPLRRPEDLRRHTLLQDERYNTVDDPGWEIWLARAGLRDIDHTRGPGYSDSSLVVQAAVAGQGVALARRSLAQDDLDAGLLVQPFGPTLVSGFSYWFVTTPAKARDPRVVTLRDWIKAEAARARGEAA